MPEAQQLALLRAAIDRKPHKIKQVLTGDSVRKSIFGGISNDEDKAVKAFTSRNRESALKTKPKVCQQLLCISSALRFAALCHYSLAQPGRGFIISQATCVVCLHTDFLLKDRMPEVSQHE